MSFKLNKSKLLRGINDCNAILGASKGIKHDFELAEVRMLGMVDSGRRMRRVFLRSQEVMNMAGNSTSTLEDMLNRAQDLYDTVNATDEYVTNLVECMQLDPHVQGRSDEEAAENADSSIYEQKGNETNKDSVKEGE